jgi:hypothetical protein
LEREATIGDVVDSDKSHFAPARQDAAFFSGLQPEAVFCWCNRIAIFVSFSLQSSNSSREMSTFVFDRSEMLFQVKVNCSIQTTHLPTPSSRHHNQQHLDAMLRPSFQPEQVVPGFPHSDVAKTDSFELEAANQLCRTLAVQ